MVATLAEINIKLDLALAGIKEIEELKEKQRLMEKENSDLRKSLDFAYESIATLTERADTQQKTLSKLTGDVNKLTQVANAEKERAIKLEAIAVGTTLFSTTFLKCNKNPAPPQNLCCTPFWNKT